MIRPTTITVVGIVVVAAAIGLNYLLWEEEVKTGGPPPSATAPGNGSSATPAPGAPGRTGATTRRDGAGGAPTFDVVRINPRGDTVMAGQAPPGSEVVILDGDTEVGRVMADERGEWVFVPDKPLPPGDRRLRLRAERAGQPSIVSDSEVVLVVPEKEKDVAGRATTEPQQPLAFRVPREGEGASAVLQRPTPPSAGETPLALAIDAVDYDENGNLTVSGRAPAGALVNLYLDNRFVGRAAAGNDGLWSVHPDSVVAPGLYSLRADHVDAQGRVLARVSIPFSRATFTADLGPGQFIIVQPGNSLWRIARRTYGSGFAYTTIYAANREQIADPDLIYPGQVFALPTTN